MKLPTSNAAVSVIWGLLVFCAIFLDSPAASHASGFMDLEMSIKELQQLVEKTGPSIVTVVSYDDSGTETGRGSGFFIDRRGAIITNASIMKGAYSAEVLSRLRQYHIVKILHRDDSLDFALIQVEASDERPLELGFDYKAAPGERVVVIGQSSKMRRTVSEGLVSSVEEKSSLMEIQTTKPLLSFRESKDGPLLNMAGEVIGVMSTAITDSKNMDVILRMPNYQNFKAVSISSIKQFISRPGQTKHLHPAKSKIWTRWIVNWLKNMAVTAFVTMYTIGFPKIMVIIIIIILIISAIQWLFMKLKKRI